MGSECPLLCFLLCLFVKFSFFFFPLVKCHFLMITSVLCFSARANCCHLCPTSTSGHFSFWLVFNLKTHFCVYTNGILTMIMGRGSIKKHYESYSSGSFSGWESPEWQGGFIFFCPLQSKSFPSWCLNTTPVTLQRLFSWFTKSSISGEQTPYLFASPRAPSTAPCAPL